MEHDHPTSIPNWKICIPTGNVFLTIYVDSRVCAISRNDDDNYNDSNNHNDNNNNKGLTFFMDSCYSLGRVHVVYCSYYACCCSSYVGHFSLRVDYFTAIRDVATSMLAAAVSMQDCYSICVDYHSFY